MVKRRQADVPVILPRHNDGDTSMERCCASFSIEAPSMPVHFLLAALFGKAGPKLRYTRVTAALCRRSALESLAALRWVDRAAEKAVAKEHRRTENDVSTRDPRLCHFPQGISPPRCTHVGGSMVLRPKLAAVIALVPSTAFPAYLRRR
jgi:hypothetical protein